MIIQGGDGAPFKVNVVENGEPLTDLLSASEVELKFKNRARTFTKIATTLDNNSVQATLTDEDLAGHGNYEVQAKVTYSPERVHRTQLGYFQVGKQI